MIKDWGVRRWTGLANAFNQDTVSYFRIGGSGFAWPFDRPSFSTGGGGGLSS